MALLLRKTKNRGTLKRSAKPRSLLVRWVADKVHLSDTSTQIKNNNTQSKEHTGHFQSSGPLTHPITHHLYTYRPRSTVPSIGRKYLGLYRFIHSFIYPFCYHWQDPQQKTVDKENVFVSVSQQTNTVYNLFIYLSISLVNASIHPFLFPSVHQ